MSNTHQMKLTCGCLVEAEVSHDWIDEKTTLDDVFILDYCPKHATVDDLLAAAKGVVELPQAHPVDICTCKYCKAFNKLKDEVAQAERDNEST